ncbi:MAG: hypothetical protein PHU91_00755 [Candidatus Omnitrophica bacterium]|nr:hypothetical protein [Candidatus Omnitrophota bacterium]MDD5236189.1 hypothetical protein [Candidatus Omnitrophota bacterium]MDD5610824.1 hypothetical protein [Candidatus Omnitrophota bacterium]
MLRLRSRGQSTLEYAALVACIVAAIIIMQRYFNRAAQGKIRGAADQVGEQFDYGKTDQSYQYTSHSKNTEKLEAGTYGTNLEDSSFNKTAGTYTVNQQ